MNLSRRAAFTTAAAALVASHTSAVAAPPLATRLSGSLIWPDYSRGLATFHADAGHLCVLHISGDEEAARAMVKSGDPIELEARFGAEVEVGALYRRNDRLPVKVAASSVVWRAKSG